MPFIGGHSYVVETITTPIRKGRRPGVRRHTGPRPGGGGGASQADAALGGHPSCGQLPRWAQSPTYDPSPVDSQVSSLNSSQLQALELDSNASFGYNPSAFVQSWHRKLGDMYQYVDLVGHGRSGAVFIVEDIRTKRQYACKALKKTDHDAEVLNREISTLKRLDHPNIVRLFGVIEDTDTVFLLMELCHGGDLYDKIYKERCLDEATARDLARQMLGALAYCHESGVVHRDVKPENFLLERADDDFPVIKLADFGIATSIRPAHVRSAAIGGCGVLDSHGGGAWPSFGDGELPGSLPYMAPELLMRRWSSPAAASTFGAVKGATFEGQPADSASISHTALAASDLWSLGVSIYVMLSGDLPFGHDPEACLPQICRGEPLDFSSKAWRNVSKEAMDLITKLLNPRVEERWTAKEALAHEWFCEGTPSEGQHGAHSVSPGLVPIAFQEFAATFVRLLRVWRQQPKLKRIAITAMARKLDQHHEIHRVAHAALALFGDPAAGERLRCERLVEALVASDICSGAGDEPPSMEIGALPGRLVSALPRTPAATDSARMIPGVVATTPSPASTAYPSSASPGSAPARLQRTRSGLHVRHRLRHLRRGLSGLAEETPTPTPTPGSCSTPSLFGRFSPAMRWYRPSPSGLATADLDSCGAGADGHAVASLEELRRLVDALDGQKDGFVDYTVLLASLLPAELYSDEGKIEEVFDVFDLHKRGSVAPDDFYMALVGGSEGSRQKSRNNDVVLRQLTEMLAQFDSDGDGRLNRDEFRALICGAAAEADELASVPPMQLPPMLGRR